MKENITADAFVDPFPHIIFRNFYNDDELKLIWQELDFYTKPNKLFEAENYGGVVGYTSAKAILLDKLYSKDFRGISNILTVNRKVFLKEVLEPFGQLHDCCSIAVHSNWDITKVRYYHDGDHYDPHTDRKYQFLAFSYFYKEPKRFEGGELLFPRYNYKFSCDNNSLIMFPGWVEHGVSEVSINNSDYFDGYGRYAITSFFGNKEKE
tara:strand:+ start:255 stop:878 length:624 start_codon:yes stop_codon:yes gene_type:complete